MNLYEALTIDAGILICAYGITTTAPAFYGAGLLIIFLSLASVVV